MSSIWTVRRSTADTKLTGLCGGLARHWGVDPVLVRVGCALLALSGGIGLVLYVAGWLLIPIEGSDQAPIDDFFGSTGRRWPKEVWITLIVLACLAVFALFGSLSPFGVAPAVVLAAIWYFGFYKKRTSAGPTVSGSPTPPASLAPPAPPQFFRYPGPPTPFTEAADAWRRRIEENVRQAADAQRTARPGFAQPAHPGTQWPTYPAGSPQGYAADPPTGREPDPAMADREAFLATADPVGLYAEPEPVAATAIAAPPSRSTSARRLRLVALIAVGLALTGLGMADGHGLTIPVAAYFGTALLIVGLALVAATWLGRARGLLPIGFLLALGLLISAANPATQLDHWNAETRIYTQVSELPAGGDTHDVGNLKIDLSQLRLTEDVTYRARIDAGQLEVVVPAGVNVRTHYAVDAGVVRAFGRQIDSGTELTKTALDPATADPTRPTLTLDLSIDVGHLEVHR